MMTASVFSHLEYTLNPGHNGTVPDLSDSELGNQLFSKANNDNLPTPRIVENLKKIDSFVCKSL